MHSNVFTFAVRYPTNGSPWLVDHCVSWRTTPSQQTPLSGCLSSLCWQLCPSVRHSYLCPLSAACKESSQIEGGVDTWYTVHVQNTLMPHTERQMWQAQTRVVNKRQQKNTMRRKKPAGQSMNVNEWQWPSPNTEVDMQCWQFSLKSITRYLCLQVSCWATAANLYASLVLWNQTAACVNLYA